MSIPVYTTIYDFLFEMLVTIICRSSDQIESEQAHKISVMEIKNYYNVLKFQISSRKYLISAYHS